MTKTRLVIQHQNKRFEPPVAEGVTIEWERSGSPGKLTFTTVKVPNAGMGFSEGDAVTFYYDDKPIFVGYVFTKSRDREHHIKVTCYDQIRYLKNKFMYNFSGYTASQVVTMLANDVNMPLGVVDNTNYVIPTLAEENISALDIILSALDETQMNTGDMFVLYDDCGKLMLRNVANMVSSVLICETTAENFDYSSSIDSDTYNSIVLYYKSEDGEVPKLYTAFSKDRIEQWGELRYFEEVTNQTIAQNKADILLKTYNKKKRELKINKAFGSVDIRGGTLIPVRLNLGDIVTNNYMLVEKVTHNFDNDHYTMDLTLEGEWEG